MKNKNYKITLDSDKLRVITSALLYYSKYQYGIGNKDYAKELSFLRVEIERIKKNNDEFTFDDINNIF